MINNISGTSVFEISPRFRRSIENRIVRLEMDAAEDEAVIASLDNRDQIRRQRLLAATQRCEALRMRVFLDRSRIRVTRTINAQ
jgi:uncharacterized coiled-coil protein SlyX